MRHFNVADFPRNVRQWAEAGRPHTGCAIVVGIDRSEFGTILRVLEHTLADRADPKQWNDYTCFVAQSILSTAIASRGGFRVLTDSAPAGRFDPLRRRG